MFARGPAAPPSIKPPSSDQVEPRFGKYEGVNQE
jgi:hypothetical protein